MSGPAVRVVEDRFGTAAIALAQPILERHCRDVRRALLARGPDDIVLLALEVKRLDVDSGMIADLVQVRLRTFPRATMREQDAELVGLPEWDWVRPPFFPLVLYVHTRELRCAVLVGIEPVRLTLQRMRRESET